MRTGSASRRGGTLLAIPTPNGTGGFTNRDYALDNLVPRPYVAAQDAYFERDRDYAIQTPLERTNVYGRATFDAADRSEVYVDSPTTTSTPAACRPTAPNVRQTFNAPAMPANASWVSPEMRALLNARPDPTAPFSVRFLVPDSFPKRDIAFTRDIFRAIGGLKGEWDSGWAWDVSYSYSHLNTTEVQKGDVSRRMIVEASTPDPLNPTRCANGNPACSLITSLTDWTPEQVAYLRVDNVSTISGTEEIAAAQLTGDLFDLPSGALATAFGAEWRKVSSQDNPAPIVRDFISAGFGERSATSGEFDVWEVYGEAIVPLIADKPFMDYVGLEVAARHSEYSTPAASTPTRAAASGVSIRHGACAVCISARSARRTSTSCSAAWPRRFRRRSSRARRRRTRPGRFAICASRRAFRRLRSASISRTARRSRMARFELILEVETSDTVTLGAVWTPPSCRASM